MLLLLLQGLGGLEQLVVGLIEADLELLDFLSVVPDITVSLSDKYYLVIVCIFYK
jgi:hypothetical protein